MKITLTGATGFVGRHLLEYSIAHHAITSILVLSRRELDEWQIAGDYEYVPMSLSPIEYTDHGQASLLVHQ